MTRIQYLDGHRGVAILLVLFFHAYTRWAEVMPFGAAYADIPLFKYGYLGVQLFFLISGFVILMTLEKCQKFSQFIYRRWLRLFPAMLICTLIIYLTESIFIERPAGQLAMKDMLAGLFFIEPYIWYKLIGVELKSIEPAFWSLYVEFKFYIIAAAFYFLLGSKRLVWTLFLCFLLSMIVEMLKEYSFVPVYMYAESIVVLLSFKHFGWFSAGAAFYMYVNSDRIYWFYAGCVISVLSAFHVSNNDFMTFAFATLLSALFAISIVSSKLQQILSNRFLLYLGAISYPLYLLHENMMVSATIQLAPIFSFIPSVVLPIFCITLISFLALFISKYAEPKVKYIIKKRVEYLSEIILLSRKANK